MDDSTEVTESLSFGVDDEEFFREASVLLLLFRLNLPFVLVFFSRSDEVAPAIVAFRITRKTVSHLRASLQLTTFE